MAKVFPTRNPPITTPTKYPIGAMKKIGERNIPRIRPIDVTTKVIGGAKYRKLIVPGWVRITSRRHLPYSKYCFASARTVDLGRYMTCNFGSK